MAVNLASLYIAPYKDRLKNDKKNHKHGVAARKTIQGRTKINQMKNMALLYVAPSKDGQKMRHALSNDNDH